MRSIFFILIFSLSSCKQFKTDSVECGTIIRDRNNNITFEKRCSDGGKIITIDSLSENGIQISKTIDKEFDVQHSYYNHKNILLKYSCELKGLEVFSIERQSHKQEKIIGNNIIVVKPEQKKNDTTNKIIVYVAYPVFTDSITISLFEDSLGIIKDIISKHKISKHKVVIEQSIESGKRYYIETILNLNSGIKYKFKSQIPQV